MRKALRMPSRSAPPRSWRLVAGLVLVAGLLMMFLGAWVTGVSFDEPFHVLRLRNYFDAGWFLLDDDLADGRPGAWVDDGYVYAPVTALLGHAVNVLLGHEETGTVAMSPAAYAVRHEVVAVIGLIGVAAEAAIARMWLRSWSWALVASAVLVAIPLWPGQSMFNVKDIPVATGYTLVTAALVFQARRDRPGLTARVGAIGVLAFGIVLGVGTRPGVWPGIAAGLVGLLLLTSLYDGGPRRWRFVDCLAGLALAQLVLGLVYPAIFWHPEKWLLKSALASSDYSGTDGYWWYLPSQVFSTVPLLLLLLGVAGWLAAIRRPDLRRPDPGFVRFALVASQCFLMTGLALLTSAFLYDGLRQVLFAAPPAALLLTAGLRHGLSNATGPQGSRRAALIVTAAGVLGLLVPTLVQLRLYPYNYTYASVVVDARQLDAPDDYWRTSVRELLPSIPEGEFVMCSPTLSRGGFSMRYLHDAGRSPVERSRDCRTDDLSPLRPYRPSALDPLEPVADTFIAVVGAWVKPGGNCTEKLGQVVRERHFRTIEMSAAYRCSLVLPTYPHPVEFAADGLGGEFLLGGWTGNFAEDGIEQLDSHGSLGFALPPELAHSSLRLTVRLAAPSGARLVVNNTLVRQLPATVGPTDQVIEIPRTVVESFGHDFLVLTLAAASAGTEPLRLYATELTPA